MAARRFLQICFARHVKSYESVSVFIGSSLPRRVRFGEEKFHSNGGSNGLVSGGFFAVVIGHCAPRAFRKRSASPDSSFRFFFGRKIARSENDRLSRPAFNQSRECRLVAIIDHIVAFPMSELDSFFDELRPFFDVRPIGDSAIIASFSSAFCVSYTMSLAQIFAQVQLPTFQTVDELIDAFLIQIRQSEQFQPAGNEVGRPSFSEQGDDLFLQLRLLRDILFFASELLPFVRFSPRGIGQISTKSLMDIPPQFPADGGFVPPKLVGDLTVPHALFLIYEDPVTLFLTQLSVWFLGHITPSIPHKVALLNRLYHLLEIGTWKLEIKTVLVFKLVENS